MALLKRNRDHGTRDDQAHDTRHDGAHDTRQAPAAADTRRDHAAPGETRVVDRAAAYDRFGGINWGAAFFGWLVAVGVAALLAGIGGAIAAAVGESENFSYSEATSNAETLGLAAAITLAVLLGVAYFAGGYVAGRMSRFDGGKQGAAAWVVGLLVTVVAAALGAVAGSEYNVLERVDLPNIPLSQEQLSTGGIVTAVVVVLLTLLAAIAGGSAGRRYHHKVDRAQGL
jgi:hypothetical protein